MPEAQVQRTAGGGHNDTRILVGQGGAIIKIETSPVGRGTVHQPGPMAVKDAVQERFGFAEMPVVAFEDLFGGKMHAATDRQHPCDLFGTKLLYENEGLTTSLFRTILVHVASFGRPPRELLRPTPQPLEERLVAEFEDMTAEAISVAELEEARTRLFADIQANLDGPAMRFLLTLHGGEPDFDAIGLPQAANLPAVKWKLQNLAKLKTNNPDKHAEQRTLIERLAG